MSKRGADGSSAKVLAAAEGMDVLVLVFVQRVGRPAGARLRIGRRPGYAMTLDRQQPKHWSGRLPAIVVWLSETG
jgi:hypothetical protein